MSSSSGALAFLMASFSESTLARAGSTSNLAPPSSRGATHHTAVEVADDPALEDEDVPRVGVGVVEAVAEDHVQEHIGAASGKLTQIESAIPQ